MEKVLEISHLSKKFGHQYALNDVNLTIRKGDVYGLIGKNGAGKTTLIKVITQLIQETDGSVSLFALSLIHIFLPLHDWQEFPQYFLSLSNPY